MPATPVYSIQRDPPWIPTRISTAPTTSSFYSDDSDTPYHEFAAVPMMPVQLNVTKAPVAPEPRYSVVGFAHPRQQIMDSGPQAHRQSKLPIFKQVRGLLGKPLPPLATSSKPDRDLPEQLANPVGEGHHGKQPHSASSTYDRAFKNRGTARRPSPGKLRTQPSKRSLSPVSTLRHSEMYDNTIDNVEHGMSLDMDATSGSPVSPVTLDSFDMNSPTPIASDAASHTPQPFYESPRIQSIKRKPVSYAASPIDNVPPTARHARSSSLESWEMSEEDDNTPVAEDAHEQHPNSHFSWTTCTDTVPGRTSTDTYATKLSQPVKEIVPLKSRFSWSTINTNANANATGSPQIPQHESHPVPPIPPQYHQHRFQEPHVRPSDAPVQSILSRKRPVQRIDREEWTPSPRSATYPRAGTDAYTATPILHPNQEVPSRTGRLGEQDDDRRPPLSLSMSASASDKRLPLPPELQQQISKTGELTRLQTLEAQEKDIVLQKRNIEKAISDCERRIKASPMDVSFSSVRDAKKRLQEYEGRLAEVLLDERELGVKLTRVRRREGGGDGLWVRRVTG